MALLVLVALAAIGGRVVYLALSDDGSAQQRLEERRRGGVREIDAINAAARQPL